MRSGVVFGEPDGFILLCNAQMQRLMTAITGKVRRNLNQFYELLAERIEPGCEKREFEGRVVCLLPDSSAWMFNKTELLIGRKKYIQLTASDITQQWELTERLRRQNDQLKRRSVELKETIDNLHILSRESVIEKAKMRAHDVLGEWLTLLLRTVRDKQAFDYNLHCTGCAGAAKGRTPVSGLRSLSLGLIDEMKAGQGTNVAPTPQDELDSLRQVFGFIGVEIVLDGKLPEGDTKGRLFVEIIREGITNAVRHGFATHISVRIDNSGSACRLEISDNGYPPEDAVTEGGGLAGVRTKLEPHGGTLNVASHPRFVLTIDLPG
jgi:signal transduction histidine kinase